MAAVAIPAEGSEKKKPEPEVLSPSKIPLSIPKPAPVHLEVFVQETEENPLLSPVPFTDPGSPGQFKTPKIGSLKDIQKRAAQSIKASDQSAVELKIETFEQAWKEFLLTVEVPTLKAVLSQVDLVLDQTKLIIRVGSTHAKNIIQLEQALLEKLRRAVSDKRLEIAIQIDPEKAKLLEESQPKKPVTNKEKYEQMKENNPMVDELIRALKLRIDHG